MAKKENESGKKDLNVTYETCNGLIKLGEICNETIHFITSQESKPCPQCGNEVKNTKHREIKKSP